MRWCTLVCCLVVGFVATSGCARLTGNHEADEEEVASDAPTMQELMNEKNASSQSKKAIASKKTAMTNTVVADDFVKKSPTASDSHRAANRGASSIPSTNPFTNARRAGFKKNPRGSVPNSKADDIPNAADVGL